MPTRRQYIEQIQRQIYGGFVTDDAEITVNLINQWLDQAIGIAAQKNYLDNNKLEGISYVNNSFYINYKNISVESDDQFLWKIELPHIPYGLGSSEGISTLIFKDSSSSQLSFPVVWLSMNQLSFSRGMRTIPNKLIAYSQGKYIYIQSTVILSQYTANVTMVSGGNPSDLDSELNVPADYIPAITEYLKQQLVFERQMPIDIPDGMEGNKTV